MTLREIYETLFPAPIARRLIEQLTDEYLNEQSDDRDPEVALSRLWLSWDDMQEGFLFWCSLDTLYSKNPTPTEEQIKEVFTKCNIPYE